MSSKSLQEVSSIVKQQDVDVPHVPQNPVGFHFISLSYLIV